MNDINQCYEILGLKPGASWEEVKQAYRDLAMVWHPDRFPADNPRLKEKAQQELKRIIAAYEVTKSHQFSYSANTKSSSSADAKTHQASRPDHKPPSYTDAKTYYEQGMEKAKRGKYKEAIADFLRAILSNSNYAEAYKYRGIAHSKLGDNQKAISDLKQAADLYLKQGSTNDYQDVLEWLKKLQPPEAEIDYYCRLHKLLSAGKWREADQETLNIMLKLAEREKEGWLRVEDIKNFPSPHLKTLDKLWVKSSKSHFGFTVQKRILQMSKNCGLFGYETFCEIVGWRKKGYLHQTDCLLLKEQHLTFSMNAPIGHLPVKCCVFNQAICVEMLSSILSHPDL